MAEELKIGMIGTGRIARVHANAYKTVQGGKLVACADVYYDTAKSFANDYGLDSYTDYNELLARKDINGVIIATPNGLHAEQMIAAAKAGKHVFCQKPIALTLEDAGKMIAVAEETGIIFQIGFMLRFTPPMPQVYETIKSGKIGDIVAIRAAIFGWEPANEWFYMKDQGGGVILDTLIHFADLVRWLGGDVERVYSEGGAYILEGAKKHKSPDNAAVMMKHTNGGVSSLFVSWTTGYGNFFFEVYGTKGTISVNLLEKQTSTLFIKPNNKESASGWSYPDLVWSYGYSGEQQYFINQILGKEKRGQATGKDGIASLELVLKAQASLDEVAILPINNAGA
jgi:myo-inositol 2-dehydrogenase/D-chiro-inositol 1-dehydrogenase